MQPSWCFAYAAKYTSYHFDDQQVRRVKNSFIGDWSPSGYRDVKVNVVVNEHICEIQLQLSEFYSLKAGQHAVYEWARDLDVTAEIQPEHLFATLSGEVLREMVNLASADWNGTGHALPYLYMTVGRYRDAEVIFRKVNVGYCKSRTAALCTFAAKRCPQRGVGVSGSIACNAITILISSTCTP